jgi:hypothetical protein
VSLGANQPGIAVVQPNLTNYYTAVGKDFKAVLSLTTEYDDLDECLRQENESLERELREKERSEAAALAASAAAAAASGASGAVAQSPARKPADEPSEDEGEDHATEFDGICVRLKAVPTLLATEHKGFKELKVAVEGENQGEGKYRREFALRFEPRKGEYLFKQRDGSWESQTLLFDAMTSK